MPNDREHYSHEAKILRSALVLACSLATFPLAATSNAIADESLAQDEYFALRVESEGSRNTCSPYIVASIPSGTVVALQANSSDLRKRHCYF